MATVPSVGEGSGLLHKTLSSVVTADFGKLQSVSSTKGTTNIWPTVCFRIYAEDFLKTFATCSLQV
jgi:hypothetical protein